MIIKRSLAIKVMFCTAAILIAMVALVVVQTFATIQKNPDSLSQASSAIVKPRYLDRHGNTLNVTYQNEWNVHNAVSLHQVPEFLQHAFIISEDKRFFDHRGSDWLARINAARQNLLQGGTVRGASTITEQVVRMLHPRPRTLWSRWQEGFEAGQLEKKFSKLDILEFYLNQVPYQGNRRGVKEAAAFYFNRDIDTLSKKEMLALSVLVRSPRWLDPRKYSAKLDSSIQNLAARMVAAGVLSESEQKLVSSQKLVVARPELEIHAEHFIEYLESTVPGTPNVSYSRDVHTTLDSEIQQSIQKMLDTRLTYLARANVKNGAVLVIDHQRNEIVAWVVGYAGKQNKSYNRMNPVIIPRQPGSTLKPFVYAKALEKGWTASTMIDDAPLDEGVGAGMHTYHNYSRDYYGRISVREALGNSLNIPAIRAIQYVRAPVFLDFLYDLGVVSLKGHPNVYGDGIALGNGEMTLLEMVRAYATLARMGDFKQISALEGEYATRRSRRVIGEDVASLIGDILSDPAAREREFGWDSILNFSQQTAVKTGTSSDYRDAWALGYNDKYTVGVWVGNLDYTGMQEITGSSGPAVTLRAVFNMLNNGREKRPLYFSANLEKLKVCIETGLLAEVDCESRDEWFVPGLYPAGVADASTEIRIRKPSHGLRMAMDPRIPDANEFFEFELTQGVEIEKVEWYVNDVQVGATDHRNYQWQLSRGEFVASARVWVKGKPFVTEPVRYFVN